MEGTGSGDDATKARHLLTWYLEHARPLLDGRVAPVILGEIDAEAEELRKALEPMPRAEVAFLGSTTVGKSTTINALLRRRLLPECRIGSTTAAKVEIRYGDQERFTVMYVGEEQLNNDLNELAAEWRKIEQDARELGEQPDYRSIDRLRGIARNALGFPPNHQLSLADLERGIAPDIRALLGTRAEYTTECSVHIYDHLVGRYFAAVESAILELPHDLLATGLSIVDLPGTGDTDQARLDALRKYIDRADQFVLVLGIALVTEDVQELLLRTDLLLRLVQRRRPLVVVGTRLDTAGVPGPDDLSQWALPPALRGLDATKAIWEAKAENRIFELMRGLIARVDPQMGGEADDTYAVRVREHFARTEFIPLNPRAALELDPNTRCGASEVVVAAWREMYPTDVELGVEALRGVLLEVAASRRREHEERVALMAEEFGALAAR